LREQAHRQRGLIRSFIRDYFFRGFRWQSQDCANANHHRQDSNNQTLCLPPAPGSHSALPFRA
jgi:hypothetical protein